MNNDMTPRVTLDGDIILDLTLDNSALGADKAVAGERAVVRAAQGHDAPSPARRRIEHAGGTPSETSSNRRGSLAPSTCHSSSKLFASNNNNERATEIVMLLTPHIVRTQELTESESAADTTSARNRTSGLAGHRRSSRRLAVEPPQAAPPAHPGRSDRAGNDSARHDAWTRGPTVAPPPGSTPVPGTCGTATAPATTACSDPDTH